MRRVVFVWLPKLATDRLIAGRLMMGEIRDAASPRHPLVVVAHRDNRQVLCAVDYVAEAQGLATGMPLTHARAMVPDLVVHPADPAGDAAALGSSRTGSSKAWLRRIAIARAPDCSAASRNRRDATRVMRPITSPTTAAKP